jgi:hypothetical protein
MIRHKNLTTVVPKCQRCVWGVINFVIINFVTYKLCDV